MSHRTPHVNVAGPRVVVTAVREAGAKGASVVLSPAQTALRCGAAVARPTPWHPPLRPHHNGTAGEVCLTRAPLKRIDLWELT